jgi:hypothetical protein
MIESHQTQIEVDEPEEDSDGPSHGQRMDRPMSDDMSEEKLLRALMEAQGRTEGTTPAGCGEDDRRRRPDRPRPQLQPAHERRPDPRAYAYGINMHEGQMRQSGEPYFTHPVAVAAILTEQRLDDATIVTALLHDTIEDTKSTYSEVTRLFGAEVAELVDGVTKLTNLQLSSTQSKQAENFRKLFMAMSKDLRVILVKLADRCTTCAQSKA